MGVPTRIILRSMFGKPVLEAGGNGSFKWVPPGTIGGHQVSWAAKLDAGVQDGFNDFAKVVIPVNEMPFNDLKIVRLEPYYTESDGIDMGVCIYMHDPNDLDQRIELSHTPLTNSAAGWRELNWPDDIPVGHHYFWYGNVTDTPDLCPLDGDNEGHYTLAQFRADKIFSTWRIYKITLDYGYNTGGGTMDDCYLTHVLINNVAILLEPSPEDAIGTKETAVSQETGAKGILGWLSSIKGFLANLKTYIGTTTDSVVDAGATGSLSSKILRLTTDLDAAVTAIEALGYEFTINGVNFNGYAKIKSLMLLTDARDDIPITLREAGAGDGYHVPDGYVFIAFQALMYCAQTAMFGRIGESGTADAAISKEVLQLANGTQAPFMTPCWGVFNENKYITVESNTASPAYLVKKGVTLYGVEIAIPS